MLHLASKRSVAIYLQVHCSHNSVLFCFHRKAKEAEVVKDNDYSDTVDEEQEPSSSIQTLEDGEQEDTREDDKGVLDDDLDNTPAPGNKTEDQDETKDDDISRNGPPPPTPQKTKRNWGSIKLLLIKNNIIKKPPPVNALIALIRKRIQKKREAECAGKKGVHYI